MSYLKKPTWSQQQNELQELIEQRLSKEKPEIRERVYQWLSDNQYFIDNELFDFYFCVAQNIAAVEVLGGSGEKIVKAKIELDGSVKAYTTQIVNTSNWISEKLESQLASIQQNQQNLDTKLIEVLSGLAREQQNLQTVSTGLVNSTSVLLKKQKQLVIQTEAARKYAYQTMMIAWIIPISTLMGCSRCTVHKQNMIDFAWNLLSLVTFEIEVHHDLLIVEMAFHRILQDKKLPDKLYPYKLISKYDRSPLNPKNIF